MAENTYQDRVHAWMLECFGEEVTNDAAERNHRFLEESLELVQACGGTRADAHAMVDYVFGRDVGWAALEVGGVSVTLTALCIAQGIDRETAAELELSRISSSEMVRKIRAKHESKPLRSPLPGSYPPS